MMLKKTRTLLTALIILMTSVLIINVLFMIYVNRKTVTSVKADYSIFENDIFQHSIFLNRSIVTIHDLMNPTILKTSFHQKKKKLDALTRAILGHQAINMQIYSKIIDRLPADDPLQLKDQIADLRPQMAGLIEMMSDLNGQIRSSTSAKNLDQILLQNHSRLLETLVLLNDALNLHSQVKSSFFKILKDNNLNTIDQVSLNLKLLILLIFLINVFTVLYFIDQHRNRRLLQEANENLEQTVQNRTEELKIKNKNLHQEIQDREKAEKEIIRQKQIAERYLELAGVVFVALNKKGEVTLINKKGCEVLGYEYEDVIGKNWFNHFIPKWLREDLVPISKQLLDGEIEQVEYYENPILTKNGQEKLIAWHNTVLKDENGFITGHLSAGEDITEKKQLEVRLRQSQKMESVGQLAGGIAHDFNNILYPIIGFTQLSQSDLPKNHPVQENLTDILQGAKRARDLVRRILLFSRKKETQLEATILQPIIQESYKLLLSTIPSYIELRLDLYQGEDSVLCDSSEIHEIILNLCTNAYHAIAGDKGQIMIRLYKENPPNDLDLSPVEYLCLSVEDTGIGISSKIKDKIFEPYVTTKEVGKGSGLGLSVVYGIVQNYNGGINFESSPETGTVFKIYLPITDQTVVNVDKALIEKSDKHGTEHILFVDDEEQIIKLGVRALKKAGYRVTGFQNSIEALDQFEANPDDFDLVITDMAMPSIVGSELAKKILDIKPDTPIIICSGYSEKLDRMKVKELNISAILDKPLEIKRLLKITRELLDKNKPN